MSETRLVPRRRLLVAGGTLGVGAVAASGLGGLTRAAGAGGNSDIEILQTAMGIDRAAIVVYDAVIELDLIVGPRSKPAVSTFVQAARDHHRDHVQAYADALAKLGGAEQREPNGAVTRLLTQARAGLTGLGPLVALLVEVEKVAAHSFQNAVGLLDDGDARALVAAIAGTEHQHLATMTIVGGLIDEGAIDVLTVGGGPIAGLPASAGTAAFPGPTVDPDAARPPGEGAVR